MLHLQDARLFARVAATGSFSEAARQLDLSPAAVSATLKKLETQLNVRLLERSTRSLRLTPEGEQFLDTCERLLAVWAEGEAQLCDRYCGLQGVMHLSAPTDLASVWLAAWLPAFLRQHPQLQVVLHASDTVQALPRDGLDMALRYGDLPDSSLVARRLCANRRVLVASPGYLRQHGAPTHPGDLVQHRCLTFFLSGRRHVQWQFQRAGRVLNIRVDGALSATDGSMVRQWALQGEGIAYKSRLDVLPDLQAGRLVPLLTDWSTEDSPLNAVLLSQKMVPLRVRRLLDFLVERFGALSSESPMPAPHITMPAAGGAQESPSALASLQ